MEHNKLKLFISNSSLLSLVWSSKTAQVTYVGKEIYWRILGYATGSNEGLNLLFRASRIVQLWGHQQPWFSFWGMAVK